MNIPGNMTVWDHFSYFALLCLNELIGGWVDACIERYMDKQMQGWEGGLDGWK
jgi:hypothetical protein